MRIKQQIIFLGFLASLSSAQAQDTEVLNCFFTNVEGAPGLAIIRTPEGVEVRENRGGFVGGSIPRPTLEVETKKSGKECTVLLRDRQKDNVVLQAQMKVGRDSQVSGTGEIMDSPGKEIGRKVRCSGDERYADFFKRCDLKLLLDMKTGHDPAEETKHGIQPQSPRKAD